MELTASSVAALLGSTSAGILESDRLATEGLVKLVTYVAENGYSNAEQCTLENVAVRRECYAGIYPKSNWSFAYSPSQGGTTQVGEA